MKFTLDSPNKHKGQVFSRRYVSSLLCHGTNGKQGAPRPGGGRAPQNAGGLVEDPRRAEVLERGHRLRSLRADVHADVVLRSRVIRRSRRDPEARRRIVSWLRSLSSLRAPWFVQARRHAYASHPCPRRSNPIDVSPQPRHRLPLTRENGRERLTFGQRHAEHRRQQYIRRRGSFRLARHRSGRRTQRPRPRLHPPFLSVEMCAGWGDRVAIGHMIGHAIQGDSQMP